MEPRRKDESDLGKIAKDMVPADPGSAYVQGSTARMLKAFVTSKHELKTLVTESMKARIVCRKEGIDPNAKKEKAKSVISAASQFIKPDDKKGSSVEELLSTIENRIISFGDNRKTEVLKQTYGQHLPRYRNEVQEIIDGKKKLEEMIAEYNHYISTKMDEITKNLPTNVDNKAQLQSKLGKELTTILDSDPTIKKLINAISNETERLTTSERKLHVSLSELQEQTRAAAAAAGITSQALAEPTRKPDAGAGG